MDWSCVLLLWTWEPSSILPIILIPQYSDLRVTNIRVGVGRAFYIKCEGLFTCYQSWFCPFFLNSSTLYEGKSIFVFVLFLSVVSTNCLSSKDYPIASLKIMYPCKWVVNIQPVSTGLIIWWYCYAISNDAISEKGNFAAVCYELNYTDYSDIKPQICCTLAAPLATFFEFSLFMAIEKCLSDVLVFGKAQIRVNSL